jgi:hypothetical protein
MISGRNVSWPSRIKGATNLTATTIREITKVTIATKSDVTK